MHQRDIFSEGSRFHRYFELSFADDTLPEQARVAIADLCALAGENVATVLALGPRCWQALGGDTLPGFVDFPGYVQGELVAPSAQGDLFVWLHADDHDALVERQLAASDILRPLAAQFDSNAGFVYRDSRDLTGFVDGSANPVGDARLDVALLPQGVPGGEGSFVMCQRWVHQLHEFGQLPVAEQEAVIGRTKADSIELRGDAMPPDSHVSCTDLKVDGIAQKIYRRSAPCIDDRGEGLFFLAFSHDPGRFDLLLRSMLGMTERATVDRLTGYSAPISGGYYFAPSRDWLDRLA